MLAACGWPSLPPAFSGASPGCTRGSRTASGQDSAPVHTLTGSRGPMFLLNSQVPLVTATCGPGGVPQDRRHPFSRSYGANLPSSLAWGYPSRLGLLTQEHLRRFSVRARGLVPRPLFTGPRSRADRGNPRLFPPSAGSRRYGTPRPSTVKRDGGPARPIPRRRGRGLRCRRAYPRGTGILTRFPFGGCLLGPALGPADPWPIEVARKTLSFPAEGLLTPLRCYYRRDLRRPRVHRTSRPGFCPTAAPPYRTPANGRRPGVSAAGLVPVHLRGLPPRRVRCYALLSRWLLLGPRPRCLGRETPFEIDTKPALGGLNPGLGCSRLGAEAYPTAPASPLLRRRQVRSLTGGRSLSAPAPPISALPHRQPPGRPGWDPLRGEPAITGLDWSFAPSPRSWERFAHQNPFGPPRGFRPASPCPGLDRPVSGLTAVTAGPFRPRPSRVAPLRAVGFPAPPGFNPLGSPRP